MSSPSTADAAQYDSTLECAKDLAFRVWDGTAADVVHAANVGVFQAICEKDLDAMPYADKKSLVTDVSSSLAEAGGDAQSVRRTTDTHYGQE